MSIRLRSSWCACAVLATFASATALAQPSTFRISQVFSSLNGNLQFIELTESAGLRGQHRLAGLTLTVTARGVRKHYVIPQDLATEETAWMSIVIAASAPCVPVTDPSYLGSEGCHEPVAGTLPPRFLPTRGATLDFAGIDEWTYASLPGDGANALYRDGTVRTATVSTGGRCYTGIGCHARLVIATHDTFAFEFHDAVRDHYFVTAFADEIDAIDAGRLSGWQRTGERLPLATGANDWWGPALPVCRFYLPPGAGDSHFYSANAEECARVAQRFPHFVLETARAFNAALPDPVTGICPRNPVYWSPPFVRLTPVYRLWNQRSDSNHRYTWRMEVRDAMVGLGYVSEGYGPLGVAMCVP